MAKAKEFDLDKYVIKVCKKAGIDPNADVFEGTDLSSDTMFLTYEDLLATVISQNWDPAFTSQGTRILNNYDEFQGLLTNIDIEKGLVPEDNLVDYLKFAKKYFPYNLFIANIFEAATLYNQINYISDSDDTVMITGETGTGKESIAKIIHNESRRRKQPFITINCAGMPDELLYAEMFGYVKGAFTGAIRNYNGYVSEIKGGTLFLDEVGDMGPKSQTGLLRFLNDKKYKRLGDTQELESDCRIICATNEFSESMLQGRQSNMRTDLYHRLSKHIIGTTPLRSSRNNIPLIIYLTTRRKTSENIQFSKGVIKYWLAVYPWPGNYRELINKVDDYVIKYIKWKKETPKSKIRSHHTRGIVGPFWARELKSYKGKTIKKSHANLFALLELNYQPEYFGFLIDSKVFLLGTISIEKIPVILFLDMVLHEFDEDSNSLYNLDKYPDYTVFNPFKGLKEIADIYHKVRSGTWKSGIDITSNNPRLNPYLGMETFLNMPYLKGKADLYSVAKETNLEKLASDGVNLNETIKKYLLLFFEVQHYTSRNDLAKKLGYDREKQLNTLLEKIGLDWPIPPRSSSKRPTKSRKQKK